MTYFLGIDAGRYCACSIIKVENGTPALVEALSFDLGKGVPENVDADHMQAFRLEALHDRLVNLLETYPSDQTIIGVERPPVMRGFNAMQQLQHYFAMVIYFLRTSKTPWMSFGVTQWKALLGANLKGSDVGRTKGSRRKISKDNVKKAIMEILNVDFGKDDDKTDATGIALAVAACRGGLRIKRG